ncbi:Panacea domain-containing protein [Candidatus Agathobaculum pullicola]|uniref:Panacea domain-containing protein n=1 Tax=Candidatus Agathobaculum pullicola TaxID=2838426 RepID=UPI003F8E6F55
MYTAKQVARYIINKCSVDKRPIGNLTLQNLLYLVWIEYHKRENTRLFDDRICAWQFGPVVPEVYYDYCAYGGMDIDRRYERDEIGIAEADMAILDESLVKYLDCSVSQLVSMTHEREKPWYQIYVKLGEIRQEIPFGLIEEMECRKPVCD